MLIYGILHILLPFNDAVVVDWHHSLPLCGDRMKIVASVL